MSGFGSAKKTCSLMGEQLSGFHTKMSAVLVLCSEAVSVLGSEIPPLPPTLEHKLGFALQSS